jgi:rfaE bifunctional protein kinase chain/domain/rfaE bifunctional protein nucleotidyltransferase chain/domain
MAPHQKIKALQELASILDEHRQNGKKIVHCHGVFDLLHIGHIRYLQNAAALGEVLIVTLSPDKFVDKGINRPAFEEQLRAEAIASLDCVHYVAVNKWQTAEETLRLLRPDFYVKGAEFRDTSSDMTGKIAKEEQVVNEIGGKLAFIDDIVFSSTNLINRYLSNLPEEVQAYLNLFRRRHNLDEVLQVLDNMSTLKVLVVGDTILDEYQYCSTLGISSKDPMLALQYQNHDLFAGGILAVANHIADFAGSVHMVTTLGTKNSRENFIQSQLHSGVTSKYFYHPEGPTLVKRRFVDSYSLNKLFEIYEMDDTGLPEAIDKEFCSYIAEKAPLYDLVLVADYGHGTISKNLIDVLCEKSRFLAVNIQANAGNRGFNTIRKYPRANYVCIAEHEMRLEMRNLHDTLRPMMETLAQEIDVQKFVVTLGKKGCLVTDTEKRFVKVPAFAQQAVDRVGAGDTFLSVTALAACMSVDNEVLGFIGNVVGAAAVATIGNKKSVDRMSTKKQIAALMK